MGRFISALVCFAVWLSATPLRALGPNQLANGSFEDPSGALDTPSDWSRQVYVPGASLTWEVDMAHDGLRSVRISNPTPNDAAWTQTVSLEPDRNYLLSGWIRTEDVAPTAGAGANLCIWGTWQHSAGLTGTNQWTYVRLAFNSGPTGTVTIGARVGYWASLTSGTAWFDDLRVSEIVATDPHPRWKILVLIYDSTDLTYTDSTGTHRVIGRIGSAQLATAAANARRFVETDIPALSGGNMVPELTIRYPGTLRRLSQFGDGWWPSQADTAGERDPGFDSVIVIWQPTVTDQATGQLVWIGSAAGLTPSTGTGQTYTTLIIEAATLYGHLNVFKHEWGHSLLYYYDAVGTAPRPTVTNHAEIGQYVHCTTAQPYVWVDETDANPIPNSIYNNQSGFTHDYYSGTTALATDPLRCLGITPAAWATGGPVTMPGEPAGTVPAAPSFLRAEPAGTRIDLQWTDNANNESGVRIERSTTGTTFAVYATVGPDAVAYNDTAVTTGTTYYYRVAAYNEAGLSTYSNTASAALASNAPPAVHVTAPVNGATFTAPASVAITADALDSDGSVARVDFLSGGTLLGTDTTSPWSFTWSNVPAGSYTLTARATDNLGATTTSAGVHVTVGASSGTREIVLYARNASIGGGWLVTTDSTAAGGARLQNPNASAARVTAPLASPTRFFEMTFNADAGRAYRLWIRGKAAANHWANDSVYVQFDRSVTQAGAAVYRIGTTSGTTYQVEDCSGCGLSGWGWQDNGYGPGVMGPLIYFAQTGQQRLRVQVREDGSGIDQIVLSAERFLATRPGLTKDDTTILPQTGVPSTIREVVLHTRYASMRSGWTVATDSTAASGARLQNPNANAARVEPPLAFPTQYFEMSFNADAGVGYRLWMRSRATANSWSNDSVWAQFDRSVTSTGTAVYRIGTTSATRLALQPVYNALLSGWGWEDNGFNSTGPLIYFSRTGAQRLRIQVREDGLGIDQIVLSAERYRQDAPGATTNDTVILPRTQ